MDIIKKLRILSTVKSILDDGIVKDDRDIQQIYEMHI